MLNFSVFDLAGAVTPDVPLTNRSDVSTPSNPQVPQALLELLGQARPSTDRKTFHEHLANYFSHTLPSTRRVDELPWQLMMSGDLEELNRVT